MDDLSEVADGAVIYNPDRHTVGFARAEFVNARAMDQGEGFGADDLRSFQLEWKTRLAAHDREVAARTLEDAASLIRHDQNPSSIIQQLERVAAALRSVQPTGTQTESETER